MYAVLCHLTPQRAMRVHAMHPHGARPLANPIRSER